ncbi:partitioning defective 3-like protein, partial [Elysia marginata]
GADHRVEVTSLKAISGGGILDPDDQLCDVVDDREQLIAEYEEQNRPPQASLPLHHHQHNGGDGASASSTGTTSPEPFSLLQHQNFHIPLSLSHHAPGDSVSSSSSSAATAPPLPALPPPSLQPLPASAIVVVGEVSEVTSRHDSSSSNCNNAVTDVVITPRDLSLGSTLRVRRGSEPNLASLVDSIPSEKLQISAGNLRPFLPRRESIRDSDEPRSESSDDEKVMRLPMTNSLDRKKVGMARFTRDSLRSSLSSRPEMYKWLEAQQRAEEHSKALRNEERLGPVEGHDGKDVNNVAQRNECIVRLQNDGGPLGIHAIPAHDATGADKGLLIQSVEPNRPVHRDGRIQPKDIIIEINGTSLQNVPFIKAQEVFRAAMDTNEICLKVLKNEDKGSAPELPLKRKTAPPVMPKPRNHAPLKPSPLTASPPQKPSPAPRDLSKSAPTPPLDLTSEVENDDIQSHGQIKESKTSGAAFSVISSSINSVAIGQNPDLLSSTLPKKAPVPPVIKPGPPIKAPKKGAAPALPARTPSTSVPAAPFMPQVSAQPSADLPINAIFNTRRIGKKIVIKLTKGPSGLGFSVTSRDNQTGGDCPIYIRNILPKGAAVQDGQLRSGDRLLEVNGVEMTGKTQAEAVAFLRTLPEGSVVELVVSRQEEVDEKFKVPRKMVENPTSDSKEHDTCELPDVFEPSNNDDGNQGGDNDDEYPHTVLPQHPSQSLDSIDGISGKEKVTLRIPLNETNSAGLGVSVKGKTQSSQTGLLDLGIFVKTVLQGGAAYKDGRLRVNDQLLEVNNIKLEGQPNTAAMEALRTAMLEEGSGSGFITLTVLRRSSNSSFPPGQLDDSPEAISPSDVAGLTGSQSVSNHHGYQPHIQPSPRSDANMLPIVHQRSSSASDTVSTRLGRFGSDKVEMPSPIPPARSKRVAALRERFSSDQGNGLRNESYTRATNESISLSPPGSNNGIRNDSYARATHDSLNDSGAFTHVLSSQTQWNHLNKGVQDAKEYTPTVDQDPFALQKQQRPHSTIGFLHGPRTSHNSISDDEAFVRDSLASRSSKEESDLSPGVDLIAPFAREGFGRQSMSEKRKGHLDPRSTETYKMVKANKESKGGFLGRRVRSFHVTGATPGAKEKTSSALPKWPPIPTQVPSSPPVSINTETTPDPPQPNKVHESVPSTYQPSKPVADQLAGMKKSSSVEDLSNPGQNVVSSSSSGNNQNRDASPMWRQNRFGRARACNDSFRAAVDRSYDALDPALMDTLEEESAESGAFTLDPSNSGRSSISSDNPEDTNSLKRRKAKEKDKKGGLLKGFLRFGKGRKSNEEAMRRSRSEERPADRTLVERRQDQSTDEPSNGDTWTAQPFGDAKTMGFVPVPEFEQQPQQRGRRLSKPDHERADEEYARLRDQHVSQQRLRSQSVDPSSHRHASSSAFTPSSWERSSPFQPYGSPSHIHRQPGLFHQDYNRRQQDDYDLDERGRHAGSQADPRRFHPAGLPHRQDMPGQDQRDNKEYFSQSDHDEGRPPIAKAVLSRAEYIQQLRALYQQRHKQRQGVYPLDDAEEKYEQQIQEMEKRGIALKPEVIHDTSRDQHLLRFTDRPPSRQLEQHRSERTPSSSSMGNNNFNSNSMYSGSGRVAGGYSSYYDYNSSTFFPNTRPHSRGATIAYESGNYHHQNVQTHGNYQYHPQQHHRQQQPYQPLQGYEYSYRSNYRDYSYSDDNNSASYRQPSSDQYAQDQFYRGPPQAYRSAPNQYPQHRSTTPYSDPTSAKV